MKDPDTDVRLAVLEEIAGHVLRWDGCPQGVPALEQLLLTEPDSFLVYNLIKYPSTSVPFRGPVLVDLLSHRSHEVRRAAASHLWHEKLDPASVARLARALKEEDDPWIQVDVAQAIPADYVSDAQAVLLGIVRTEGPAWRIALNVLADRSDGARPLLEVLSLSDGPRGEAINLLSQKLSDSAAHAVLLDAMRTGPLQHRFFAARGLLLDVDATDAEVWRAFVLDEGLPLSDRAALVIEGGERTPWQPVACAATLASRRLSEEVDRLLADDQLFREARDRISWLFLVTDPKGWIRPAPGRQSVRCARRPFGGPRPGEDRLPEGTSFTARHAFVQDGVKWLAEASGDCWVPEDNLVAEERPQPAEDILEADLPREVLDSLQAGIAAGDVEVFDSTPSYVGIRVRGADATQLNLWKETEKGRIEVLAEIEAKARARLQNR